MKDLAPEKKYIGLSIVLFALFTIVSHRSGHAWDTYCWADWSSYILNNGLGAVYHSSSDYLPLWHYILKIYASLQGSIEAIHANKHYLKMFTLVFHFLTGYFVYLFVKRTRSQYDTALFNSVFYLVNVAVLYNVLIWNQVDIILACLVFISVYFAFVRKPLLALIFLLLALNFKLHAVIFIPVIGLILLPGMVLNFSFRKLIAGFFALALLQFIILLPFIIGGSVHKLPVVITGSVDKYPVISAWAFNLWHFFFSGDLANTPDSPVVFGLSYKSWGLVFFLVFSTFTLFPLLKHVFISFKTKSIQIISLERTLLMCALIPLVFFYFNTQMHERYSHPALPFLITWSIITRRPLLAVLASLAYVLNLEAELQYMQFPHYGTVIFDPRFVSGLYLLTIAGLFFELYRPGFRKTQSLAAE